MKKVHEALRAVLATAKPTSVAAIPIANAVGKILRKKVVADRDYPPFNKSLMDGIAISFKVWQQGQRTFPIEKTIPAGVAAHKVKNKQHCVEIMTGAVVPDGFDCVIPVENIIIKDRIATLLESDVSKGQYIRYKAADIKKGKCVLEQGHQITPAQIGVLASVGHAYVNVSSIIRIAVVSTGDELVDVDQPIKNFQTRLSNGYALKAVIESTSLAHVTMFHLKDDENVLYQALQKILKVHDVVILSGGVSKGKFDFIPDVLKRLNVRNIFHGVDQKPGKPFWFGLTQDHKPVFGLPGNPASTLVCVYQYVIPFLYSQAGATYQQQYRIVGNISKKSSTGTFFMPVRNDKVVSSGGSGDFISWAEGDGFIAYDNQQKNNLRPYFSWRL